MLALAKSSPGFNGLSLREIDVPQPASGEILVKVHSAGICGTDMHIYHGLGPYAKRMKLPTVLGHELCGTVTAIGADVSTIKVGDIVSIESHIPCWNCIACRTGRAHVCPDTRYPGIDINGAFAEYVTLPASIAWVNPPNVSQQQAALLEPLGIAVHAALEGSGVAGQRVVINGCGPIGLMNIAVARHFGARTVIGVDPNPLRRKVAEQMGADVTIDPAATDVPRAVKDLTGEEGADVVFEYTGSQEGVVNCFAMLGALGQVRWVATPSKPFEFDFSAWRKSRPTIFNISGRRIWQTWEKTAPLLYEKKIDLKPVISHVLPLKESLRAFELIVAGQAIKPVIDCS